jgi:hypothetical protein
MCSRSIYQRKIGYMASKAEAKVDLFGPLVGSKRETSKESMEKGYWNMGTGVETNLTKAKDLCSLGNQAR